MEARINTGLKDLNAIQLVSKAETLLKSLTGNSYFPTPEPSLADIKAKQDELLNLIADVENKERNAVSRRNACHRELSAMINKLAAYVTLHGNGDRNILLTSGFAIRKKSEPCGKLMPPVNVLAVRTTHKDRICLSWASVKGSISYVIQMTTGDPSSDSAVWMHEKVTARCKAEIDNLTPGLVYSFRVMAINSNDESAFSDACIIMAA